MDEFLRDWCFARSETLELLHSLDDEQLAFKPKGSTWQSLAYQFVCIARTQLVFAKALAAGNMDYMLFRDPSLPDKQSFQTKPELLKLLDSSNIIWLNALKNGPSNVQWPEREASKVGHGYRLIAHERLHHGQLISYFTLAGFALPPQFKQNWAL